LVIEETNQRRMVKEMLQMIAQQVPRLASAASSSKRFSPRLVLLASWRLDFGSLGLSSVDVESSMEGTAKQLVLLLLIANIKQVRLDDRKVKDLSVKVNLVGYGLSGLN
jgi:hypothetical protein